MEVLVWTLKQSIEKLEKENTDLKNKLSIAEARTLRVYDGAST